MTRQEYDWVINYLETITIGRADSLNRLAIISSMKQFLLDYIDYEQYDQEEYISRLEAEKAELKSELQTKTDYCNILKGLVNKDLLKSLDSIVKEEKK
jgi:hypothetical protein